MSYLDAVANNADSAADTAASRERRPKTANLPSRLRLRQPWNPGLFPTHAVELLGPMHESARQFLVDLGRKITAAKAAFCFSAFQFCCTALIQHSVVVYEL